MKPKILIRSLKTWKGTSKHRTESDHLTQKVKNFYSIQRYHSMFLYSTSHRIAELLCRHEPIKEPHNISRNGTAVMVMEAQNLSWYLLTFQKIQKHGLQHFSQNLKTSPISGMCLYLSVSMFYPPTHVLSRPTTWGLVS